MKVGMTGSRQKPTQFQMDLTRKWLLDLGATELHHGDCVGADEACHELARELGLKVVVHPPVKHDFRAYCVGDEERECKPYLERNHDIVDETEFLLALPATLERTRSGTWSTVRYARRIGRELRCLPRADESGGGFSVR